MARLPLIDPANTTGDAKRVLDNMPTPLNIFRMMAHAETIIKPAVKLGGAILSKQELGAKERELLILQVASLEGGEYEWNQHVPIAAGCDVRADQIDALGKGRDWRPGLQRRGESVARLLKGSGRKCARKGPDI